MTLCTLPPSWGPRQVSASTSDSPVANVRNRWSLPAITLRGLLATLVMIVKRSYLKVLVASLPYLYECERVISCHESARPLSNHARLCQHRNTCQAPQLAHGLISTCTCQHTGTLVLPRVGVSRLRRFLERRVEDCYKRNVARIVPLLQRELTKAEARLLATEREMSVSIYTVLYCAALVPKKQE
jgi:hypothetical protein